MRLSMPTSVLDARFSYDRIWDMMAEVGFDAIDLTLTNIMSESHPLAGNNHVKKAEKLRESAQSRGLVFNQAHAPFPIYREGDEEYNRLVYAALIRSMEIASIVGAQQIVVHPSRVPENPMRFNMDFYRGLIPYCERFGIRVAIENLYGYGENGTLVMGVCSTSQELCTYIDTLDSPWFAVCLDIGHSGLTGQSAAEMIHTLTATRLKALHVHDNDLIKDLHTLPFTGKLDWEGTTSALRDIGYSGDLTLEANLFLNRFPDELILPAMRLMAETGRYLIQQCQSEQAKDEGEHA